MDEDLRAHTPLSLAFFLDAVPDQSLFQSSGSAGAFSGAYMRQSTICEILNYNDR